MKKTGPKKSWRYLVKGDVVDVVAPGFRCSDEELKGAVAFLESMGLEPRVPSAIFHGKTMFSHSDEFRLEHLAYALRTPDSKAVWCVRGGYGSIRLLPKLKNFSPPSQPKVFLGYSDITSLHSFLNQTWGWSTLHSPVLDRFGGGRAKAVEKKDLVNLLFGKQKKVSLTGLRPLNEAARKTTRISSSVIGGNVAVLQSSLATPFEFKAKGRILFLEDIGERPHRMDRMLTQLEQSHALKGVKAILFGDMVLSDKREWTQLWNEVLKDFALRQSVPVFRGLKAGHGPIQRTLPFNTKATLHCGSSGRIEIDSGGRKPEGESR